LRILEQNAAEGSVILLSDRAWRPTTTATLTGSSPAVAKLRTLVSRLADSSCTVLIRGETGCGKEVVARALHQEGARRQEPFLAVNCSALPSALIESLVFGHERGAFTGADKKARGQLELARGGTVLLDEIAEMPAPLQSKLLRVLEDRKFRPLGSETEVELRARILAATHVDLERRIGEGRFREDLYYRLNVVTIDVPPLAERVEDIPALVDAFCEELGRRLRFTDGAMTWLTARRWPGNIRELHNVVERVALLVEGDEVDVAALDRLVRERSAIEATTEIDRIARALLALPARVGSKLDLLERAVLQQALAACGGNKSAAARLVGISRKAIERRLARSAQEICAPPTEDDGE
jgi:DNA-binding NtrC family response regulator